MYYVYILSSRSRNLYTGVTNNVFRRVAEHKKKLVPGFTAKYRIDRLVYYEPHESPRTAIEREKQIKSWRREKRVLLIESMNPAWDDLYPRELYPAAEGSAGPSSPGARRRARSG